MLLTRVPAGWLAGPDPIDPARAVWAFPLIGAAIGAAGGLVIAAGSGLGLAAPLAAVWALAAMVSLSGALHEDGLADVADGFGGGRTRDRKLEIMRDSRIGSYGALALTLAVMVRVFAMAGLGDRALPALIVAGALSRGGIAVPLLLLGPARAGGLGASVAGAGGRRWMCLLLALGIVAVVLPPGRAIVAAGVAAAAALCVSLLARAQIGGVTGDVLGGCAVVTECAVLSCLA